MSQPRHSCTSYIIFSLHGHAICVDLPVCGRDSGNPFRGLYFALVDSNFGQLSWSLIPSYSLGLNGVNVDISSKVAREVAEMCSLFDDRASTLRYSVRTWLDMVANDKPQVFVPPIWLQDWFICTCITCNSGHDCEVILPNNFLHCLYRLQVAKHIPRRVPWSAGYFTQSI